MKVTDFTKRTLKIRRDREEKLRDGWELVDEAGGKLWELQRGYRWDHRIIEVQVAACGKALWIKTAPASQRSV